MTRRQRQNGPERGKFAMSRVICGDAVTELAQLPVAAFACVITSPPYNLGWTNPASKAGKGEGRKRRWRGGYAGGDTDDMPLDDYVQYHRAALDGMLRAMRPDGLLWYVHRRQPRFDGTMMPALIDRVLSGYPVRAELVWDKGGPVSAARGRRPPAPITRRQCAKASFCWRKTGRR